MFAEFQRKHKHWTSKIPRFHDEANKMKCTCAKKYSKNCCNKRIEKRANNLNTRNVYIYATQAKEYEGSNVIRDNVFSFTFSHHHSLVLYIHNTCQVFLELLILMNFSYRYVFVCFSQLCVCHSFYFSLNLRNYSHTK